MSKQGLRVNEAIRIDFVRLIDQNNNQVGVIKKYEAQGLAREAGLDLVEVAPTSEPPVCKIMDYGKWLYEEKRKQREGRKKNQVHHATLKEVRLRPETDTHDLEIKVNRARKFLEKGHKVQFSMFFRGRQMLHKEKGHKVFAGITESLEDIAKVDQPAKMAHRRMIVMFVPKQV